MNLHHDLLNLHHKRNGIRITPTMTPPIMAIDSRSNNPLPAPYTTNHLPKFSTTAQIHYYLLFKCYCANPALDPNGICRHCVDLYGSNPAAHTEVDTLRDPNDAAQYPMFRYSKDTHELHIRDYGFGSRGYCPVKTVAHFVRRSTRLHVSGVKK